MLQQSLPNFLSADIHGRVTPRGREDARCQIVCVWDFRLYFVDMRCAEQVALKNFIGVGSDVV